MSASKLFWHKFCSWFVLSVDIYIYVYGAIKLLNKLQKKDLNFCGVILYYWTNEESQLILCFQEKYMYVNDDPYVNVDLYVDVDLYVYKKVCEFWLNTG